ncbi:hypothetical protein FQA39_LY12115 [Lamprigera yunnana]|nr:hypothetical protein FQA39_LY12115 [Lamprigera yunnana]
MVSTEEKMLKLIGLYKNYPILWKPSGPDNLKAIRKELAWQEISQQFGESVEKCQIRINSVLNSYRKEKLQMEEFKASRVDYVSKWYAFKALEFLPNNDKLKEINRKRQNFTESDENVKRTANSPSDNDQLQAFINYVITKMNFYSKETRKETEQAINTIMIYADRGHFEQHSNINQSSTSYEQIQRTYSDFLNSFPYQTEFQQNTTNPKVSMQSSDESSSGSETSDIDD